MRDEGQTFDRKSIRYALGKHADLEALAADCVGTLQTRDLDLGVFFEQDPSLASPPSWGGRRSRSPL